MNRERASNKSSGETLCLADKIPAHLHTLFVGINPAVRSAQVGHYYAHPTNMFWTLVTESGLSAEPVSAEDDDKLVEDGYGFTDVAKRPTARASELESHEFHAARARLHEIVKDRKPNVVAFVSKRAARAFLGAPSSTPIKYGLQSERFLDSRVWFLPSTSGQSRGDTSYEEKLREFRKLAVHLRKHRRLKSNWHLSWLAAFLEWAKRLAWRSSGDVGP